MAGPLAEQSPCPSPHQHHGTAASPDVAEHEQPGGGERGCAAEQHGVVCRRALPPRRAARRAGRQVAGLVGFWNNGGSAISFLSCLRKALVVSWTVWLDAGGGKGAIPPVEVDWVLGVQSLLHVGSLLASVKGIRGQLFPCDKWNIKRRLNSLVVEL